ncbi:hypothetical protein A5844_000229 [Enterococcus sp. 10A9_DIV0425]|uniref:Beta-carotene 15,15'-monooxygenase n=1 Tax=Candidatus Enterococcus wittei TaxID=1987383 RepID=A0A2C9XRH5_9ENTE|nr:permease prefix domain 1-containing protein [Enterococcus sp. 10A9_DIV0425]OTP12014.1 hypothetical protein A5844_000229 [Enterococcus sp. 10A9_DIV0425]THE10666.1 beta-carotene 15,15'-monooxygenase [Enterococcus hirae]
MKIIRDYLDTLFLNIPDTPETKKAKEDLLAIMEDHYHELIQQGKSEHEAIGAVISEFGSIDELLQELQLAPDVEVEQDWSDAIDLEEATNFWQQIRHFSLFLSLGIAFCISSIGIFLFFANHLNSGVGLLVMFMMIALGVGFIITSSMNYSSAARKLNDRPFSKEVKLEASRQLEDYEKSFRVGLVLGIGLCIVSVTPFFLMDAFLYLTSGTALLMFFVSIALGVFFIVYVSIIHSWFSKMAEGIYFVSDEDKPGPRASQYMYGESSTKIQFIKSVYWPVILVIYFLWSFIFESWAYSWVIFIIGGVVEDLILKKYKSNKDK